MKKKRLLSLALTLCMLLSLLPTTAMAVEATDPMSQTTIFNGDNNNGDLGAQNDDSNHAPQLLILTSGSTSPLESAKAVPETDGASTPAEILAALGGSEYATVEEPRERLEIKLLQDVPLKDTLHFKSGYIQLYLNGHTLTGPENKPAIRISNSSTRFFILGDTKDGKMGKIIGGKSTTGTLNITNSNKVEKVTISSTSGDYTIQRNVAFNDSLIEIASSTNKGIDGNVTLNDATGITIAMTNASGNDCFGVSKNVTLNGSSALDIQCATGNAIGGTLTVNDTATATLRGGDQSSAFVGTITATESHSIYDCSFFFFY